MGALQPVSLTEFFSILAHWASVVQQAGLSETTGRLNNSNGRDFGHPASPATRRQCNQCFCSPLGGKPPLLHCLHLKSSVAMRVGCVELWIRPRLIQPTTKRVPYRPRRWHCRRRHS